MSNHATEVARGKRFEFGANWRHFLEHLTPGRVEEAQQSLTSMLAIDDWHAIALLDVGCGSGLFSLAARRLEARVVSFDYDPQSVACTRELQQRYFPSDDRWSIREGSALDRPWLESLGKFDVVYAWGVLHHTGNLWQAMDNAAAAVAPGGRLLVAIYNYQPLWSGVNTVLKRTYVAAPRPGKWLLAGGSIALHAVGGFVKDLLRLRNPLLRFRQYDRGRGMSWWHDQLDWVGGYPFETARPEDIVAFYRDRGFELERSVPCRRGSSGCNQFVFRRRQHDG